MGKNSNAQEAKNKKKSWLRWIWIPAVGVAAICFLFFISKNQKKEDTGDIDPYAEIYRYPMERINAYCVGEDGTIYLVRKDSNVIEAYNETGERLSSYPMDMDGVTEITNTRDLDLGSGKTIPQKVYDDLAGLCYQEGKLYCFRGSTGALFCLDLATGKGEVAWQTEWGKSGKISLELSHPIDVAVSGDKVAIFFQGEMEMEAMEVGQNTYPNTYLYLGERLALLDLKSGELSITEYRNLVYVAAKGRDGFLVEGYDRELGYYFAELSGEGMMSEKHPTGLTAALYFGWDEEQGMFHGQIGRIASNGQCVSGTVKEANTAYRYYANELKADAHSVRYLDGHLYILDRANPDETGTLVRLMPKPFLQEGEPLRVVMTKEVSEPDWQGYPVEVERLEAYELALKLLAGDDDFDFIVMSTEAEEAWNIRRVMAYYPLNEVAGELLDSCFPAVREAARNGEDIWMLPLSMDATGIVYSEGNAKKAGASLEGLETAGEWMEQAIFLYRQGYADLCTFWKYSIENWLMLHYINANLKNNGISFHTEEFGHILDQSLEVRKWTEETGYLDSGGWPRERYQHIYDYVRSELGNTAEADRVAEQIFYDTYCQDIILWWPEAEARKEYTRFQGREGFSLIPLPMVDGSEGEFPATLQILVVNPNSRRLARVLRVAGRMTEGAVKNPENWLTADRQCYLSDSFTEQVYQAYQRAVVYQVPPAELYDKYCSDYFLGSIGREELLDTLERVLNAYYLE